MANVIPSLSIQFISNPLRISHLKTARFACSASSESLLSISKRQFALSTIVSGIPFYRSLPSALAETSSSSKSFLSGIANTSNWFQYYGDGFSIRVPPQFQDITEPEDFNTGTSFYGDKVKPKTFAARFASEDGYEVVSVIIRPTNQLKITFLEAKDISDLGSLKEAAKIFVPGGASLFSARTLKVKEDDLFRTYYFYEFSRDDQRVAMAATVDSGKAFISAAVAPKLRWVDEIAIKLRSAAISLAIV